MAIAWLLALAAIGYLVVTAVSGLMLDPDAYRAGGQAILHGTNLYKIRAADKLPFTYPPVSAVLAVPLALVQFQVARIGWIVMVYLPLLFAVWIGFRPLLERTSRCLIWLPVVLIVAVGGFAAARTCWKHGNDLAGITITGLLGALLSPVAWIHHLCWVLVAIGVIAGCGRSARRNWLAALTGVLFLSPLPIWAEVSLSTSQVRSLPGFLLENSFGLRALGLIPVLFWIGAIRAEPLLADAEPAAAAEPA